MDAFVLGFGLGFVVALQLGPMSLFLVRSTLRFGWAVGAAIAAGIAVVDALYAACGAAGAAALLRGSGPRARSASPAPPCWSCSGARTLAGALRVRLGGEVAADVATPRRAFLTALGGTASNPLTIGSWGRRVPRRRSVAGAADTTSRRAPLVAGVGAGSLAGRPRWPWGPPWPAGPWAPAPSARPTRWPAWRSSPFGGALAWTSTREQGYEVRPRGPSSAHGFLHELAEPRLLGGRSALQREAATWRLRRGSPLSLKPNVAYLDLNFCALWKKQTTLPSLAYAGIPYQVLGERAGALALTMAWTRSAMARSGSGISAIFASTSLSPSALPARDHGARPPSAPERAPSSRLVPRP